MAIFADLRDCGSEFCRRAWLHLLNIGGRQSVRGHLTADVRDRGVQPCCGSTLVAVGLTGQRGRADAERACHCGNQGRRGWYSARFDFRQQAVRDVGAIGQLSARETAHLSPGSDTCADPLVILHGSIVARCRGVMGA
ncbi:hypothetical protein GCM10009835_03490 [Planosporangium flavigriseum]|uniref:Uncharacterized protein n=1 Tax=Planosporangium flavigriseum TaxID=373681 RepID=A0A8J3LLM6_9ACTN|nr:hypothetical protein Pfl04_19930 [Planosporangium flavigriseum]